MQKDYKKKKKKEQNNMRANLIAVDLTIAQILLSHGAKASIRAGKKQQTPFFYASQALDTNILQALYEINPTSICIQT